MSSRQRHSADALGTILFGVPCADAQAADSAPEQLTPDTWLASFIKHNSPAVRSAIFSTTRAGRALVLRYSPALTLRLNLASADSPQLKKSPAPVQASQISSAAGLLAARPVSLTKLVVLCDGSEACAQALLALPAQLGEASKHVTELEVLSVAEEEPSSCSTVTAFLQATPMPLLHSLTLSACPGALPPPSHYPHLQSVFILSESKRVGVNGRWTACSEATQEEDTAIRASIAPYTPQLSHMIVGDLLGSVGRNIAQLFSGVQPSQTLTHLGIQSIPLTDKTLTLILKHTPQLVDLGVKFIDLGVGDTDDIDPQWLWAQQLSMGQGRAVQASTGQHSAAQRQWSVQQLRAVSAKENTFERDLVELPVRADGGRLSLSLAGSIRVEAPDAQGLSPALCARLSTLTLTTCKSIMIDASDTLAHTDQPTALRAVTQQLATLTVPKRTVVDLRDHWQCDMPTLQALADTLPQLPTTLVFGLLVNAPLTDAVFSAVHALNPRVASLWVQGIEVETDWYAKCDGNRLEDMWVMGQLTVPVADMAALARLPLMCGCEVKTGGMVLDGTELAKVGYETVWCRLSSVMWRWDGITTVNVRYGGDVTELPHLLHSLCLTDTPIDIPLLRIALQGWPITPHTMKVLSEFPCICGTLDLTECYWPSEPHEYVQLAKHVRVSFHTWEVSAAVAPAKMQAITDGLVVRRGELVSKGLRGAFTLCVRGATGGKVHTEKPHPFLTVMYTGFRHG